jgi:hypothetical protein
LEILTNKATIKPTIKTTQAHKDRSTQYPLERAMILAEPIEENSKMDLKPFLKSKKE